MKEVVNLSGIHKFFPGVHALKGVDLKLYEGEVVALLGENGAGKSTLMKVLSGIHIQDEGSIEIDGELVTNLSPKLSQELGISIIHQELNMCSHLTVAENIFLGREEHNFGINHQDKMNKKAHEILKKIGVDLKPTEVVGNLSVSKQQMVEIAKALSMNSKVLIMDEPTSALSFKEIEDLFKIINNLKASGTSIVYISHRLEELKHIVDRVVVLRDGSYITEMNFKDTTTDEIITHMVGREIKEKFPRIEKPLGETVFEVENISGGIVHDVSFKLHEGEIVGIAGLVGAGRTELTRMLFGIDPKETGTIKVHGQEVIIKNPKDSIRHRLALAPEDRKKDGLCTKLSIKDNISLSNLDSLSNRFGVINRQKESQLNQDSVENLKIKVSSLELNADSLSGGNQQKVVVAKWLARDSHVVIFDEPTRGIDVAAKIEIYNLMNQLKDQGVAVLFVSSEMPEVLGISDRILVMCDGRITANLDTVDTNQEEIMKYATMFEEKRMEETNHELS